MVTHPSLALRGNALRFREQASHLLKQLCPELRFGDCLKLRHYLVKRFLYLAEFAVGHGKQIDCYRLLFDAIRCLRYVLLIPI
jgi:hypothetical protein